MDPSQTRTAVITGASSGIGEATAVRLAGEGWQLVLGARRIDKLEDVAGRTKARALALDVRDPDSIAAFVGAIEEADVLVNNAGLALGLDPVAELSDDDVITMWETNVLGLLRMTRALLPKLEASGNGHIVNLGSTAALETYPGGGGYTSSKHAVRALTRTMRLDLLGKPIRITDIHPGMVATEFSDIRFHGDTGKAAGVYEGITPLVAEDLADCIAWAVTRPWHVNIDEIVLRPVAQATSTVVARDAGL